MDWRTVTDFGDSAAMLPAAGLLFAWLVVDGKRRAAALWAVLFVLQSGLVAATKIAFRGWGLGIEALDFTGISGHSTLACSVLPILFGLIARPAGRWASFFAVAVGVAGGVLIGISRVALAQHSWSEVIAGCGLGSLVALLFLWLADPQRASARLPIPAIASVFVVLLLLMHGTRAPSERLITRVALHLSGHAYPYTRDDLHDPSRRLMWGAAPSLGGGGFLAAGHPTHSQAADLSGVHIHDPEFQS